MSKKNKETTLKDIGTAIGVGLIAGFAGTFAITVSQRIEMEITGRKPSDTPANAVREVLDVKPVSESKSQQVSQEVHWAYGTSLGLIRSILSLAGLRGLVATAIHFFTIWSGKSIMLPSLRVAKPVTEQHPKSIAIDMGHHLIYAATAGLVFDAVYCEGKNKKKKKYSNSDDKFEMYRKIKDDSDA